MDSKRSFLLMIFLAGISIPAFCEGNRDEIQEARKTTELTIDDYARLALQESLNAQIARHTLSGNMFSTRSTYLSLRAPTLAYGATANRSETKGQPSGIDDQNTMYDTSLTYAQPLYATGGNLQAVLDQNESENVNEGTDPLISGAKPELNVTYTQPLFLFIQDPNKRAWRRAELNYENQLDSYETQRLNVIYDSRTLYEQVLLDLAELDVQKEKLRSSEEVKKIAQAMVRAGRSAPIEENRAEIRLHDDERALQNARVVYWQAVNQAKDRVGISRDAAVVFASTLSYTPCGVSLEKLIEYSYIHQPAIRSARRNVELAEISFRETQETTRPHFNLTATGGLANVTGTQLLTTDVGLPATTGGLIADYQRSWSAQFGVSWPFFDSHKTQYAVLAARENLETARLRLQSQERSTQVQVSNAYLDIKRTEEQILDFDVNRSEALENVRIIEARYRQGLDRLIDVFDAEDQARSIDLEYLNLLFTFTRSLDAISELIGGDARKVT